MKKNKLAIFDMDGTLFDTKDVNYTAYTKALEACGFDVEIDYKYYCEFCNGNNYKVFLPQIIPGISNDDLKRVHDKKKELYKESLGKARMNQHLFSIIDAIKSEYQVALVTTASLRNVEDILNQFQVRDSFDFLITQDDVKNTKPSPECFLLAMERAGVTIEDTLIFEDSETGLAAAEASGANYVRVYGYN